LEKVPSSPAEDAWRAPAIFGCVHKTLSELPLPQSQFELAPSLLLFEPLPEQFGQHELENCLVNRNVYLHAVHQADAKQ
jgi:hypothetical protein